jgi:hypothetical protein
MNSLSSSVLKCVAVLKTGLNKGTVCKNHVKHGTFCGIHKKNIQESVSVAVPVPVAIPESIQRNNVNHEIYIIQLSEHIRCKDDIFKVGMTRHGATTRFKGYPKNSEIKFSTKVKDALSCERFVLENCRKEKRLKSCDRNNPEKYKRLGNEYFEGDYNLLLKIVKTSCEDFNKKHIS